MRALILLPTLNEAENLRPLVSRLLMLGPDLDVMVVDESSPDGTYELARKLSEETGRVIALRNPGKRGRGAAGIYGFKRALEEGRYWAVVEMDADFSHDPVHVPALLSALSSCDIAIGSRFVRGGADGERSIFRCLISRIASFLGTLLLTAEVRDVTSGFRAFRVEFLKKFDFNRLSEDGPSFVTEMLFHSLKQGARVREIPIIFRKRRAGRSSLTAGILLRGFFNMVRLAVLRKGFS